KGRLERGRHQLRLRLAKRGLTLPAAFAGLLVAGSADALSPALVQATLAAARPGASATPAAVSLARAAMRKSLNKLKALCAAGVRAMAGSGLGMVMMRQPAAKDRELPAPLSAGVPGERGVDIHGDPLPEGAVMRLGTIRRRAVGAQLAVSADGKSIISVRAGK